MRTAKRRANDQKMQRIAERIERQRSIDSPPDPKKIKLRAKKIRDHLKSCSCSMCCNPRKKKSSSHERETLKEKLSRVKMEEEKMEEETKES